MIGEIRQNFTGASASVGLILATALTSSTKPKTKDLTVCNKAGCRFPKVFAWLAETVTCG